MGDLRRRHDAAFPRQFRERGRWPLFDGIAVKGADRELAGGVAMYWTAYAGNYILGPMPWVVDFHDDFVPEFDQLPEGVQDEARK